MKVTLKVTDLKTIYDACKCFVSKDNVRPIWSTVLLSCSDGYCTAYALDGIKLMSVIVPYQEGEEGTINIPIIKIPKEPLVIISDEKNDIVFDFITHKQTFRKYEDKYPKRPEDFFNNIESKQKQIFSIGFNIKNLKDALNGFRGDERISIDFYGEVNPCIVKSENKKAMVLPVKLKRG